MSRADRLRSQFEPFKNRFDNPFLSKAELMRRRQLANFKPPKIQSFALWAEIARNAEGKSKSDCVLPRICPTHRLLRCEVLANVNRLRVIRQCKSDRLAQRLANLPSYRVLKWFISKQPSTNQTPALLPFHNVAPDQACMRGRARFNSKNIHTCDRHTLLNLRPDIRWKPLIDHRI